MKSLKATLEKLWQSSTLPQSCIITTQNYQQAELEIMEFIKTVTAEFSEISPENNTDIFKVALRENKKGESLKALNVEQIRELQDHFSSTSGMSPFKFGVIIDAEMMNLNASNCMLKILEDTPQQCFIFLVTGNLEKLIPTIRSRCIVIYRELIKKTNLELTSSKAVIFKLLNPEVRFEDKVKDIENFTNDKKIKNQDALAILSAALADLTILSNKSEEIEYLSLKEYIRQHNIESYKIFEFVEKALGLLEATKVSFLDLKQVIILLISKFILLKSG